MNSYNIEQYEFEEKPSEEFIDFMRMLYRDRKHINYYLQAIKRIKNKSNPSFNYIKIKNFIAYSGKEVAGHISTMIDKRLEKNIGILGFYECINNNEAASALIETAINYLKENSCDIIRAPINLTIWHSYRFVVEQKDTFVLEPITKDYYIKQFTNLGFEEVAEYGTGQRTDYQTILPYTKPAYDSLIKEGFKILQVDKNNLDECLLLIYEIAKRTFTDSWSYVEISKNEYMYIYQDTKEIFDNLLMEIIYNSKGEAVGFCSSIYDSIDKESIILKSIAVLPEYQNKKVGAALIYSQHKKAFEKGISKMIYALVTMGNTVTKLPYPGVEVIRKYVALERKLANNFIH